MTRRKGYVAKRRKRLSIEALEPRRLLDVSGVWQELGYRSASGSGLSYDGQYTHSGDPAVVNTPFGQTVAVYEDATGLAARIYDGYAWSDLYTNPTNPADHTIPNTASGRDPDVDVDSYGNVYITWLEGFSDDTDVYMTVGAFVENPLTGDYRWTWQTLAGADTGTGLSDDGVVNGAPAIAVGVDNLPVIAYSAYDELDNDMDVVVKKYIEGQWIELTSGPDFNHGGGGASNDELASGGWADSPQPVDIAIGSDNAPIVVWSSTIDMSIPAEIYARRWNQVTNEWQKIGGNSANDPNEDPVSRGISADDGNSVSPRIQIERAMDTGSDRDLVMVSWIDYADMDELDTGAVYVKQLTFDTSEDGFEAGSLGGDWSTYSSDGNGRIQVTNAYDPATGTYSLWMDRSPGGGFTLNEAIWTVDLTSVSEAMLSFRYAEYGDTEHAFAGSPFTNHTNADGVAISDDGTTWYPIWSATDQDDGEWEYISIDLAAEAAAVGIELGPGFQIKFQQYDDASLTSAGRGWDDVSLQTASWEEVSASSASGDGITGERGFYRYLSLEIGTDGLPLIGVTRRMEAATEYAIDTTVPWTASYYPSTLTNWYAFGMEAWDNGGTIEWRWLGPVGAEVPNYGVTWAQNTEIIELVDGTPVLFYGAERGYIPAGASTVTPDRWVSAVGSTSSHGGGPWDPGYSSIGATDSEVFAHQWNSSESAWEDIGDGSGSFGGVDDDIRWNSNPMLATAEDGRVLMAYLERIGTDLYVRVLKYNEDTGVWDTFGQENPLIIGMTADEVANYTYRWDELVIASDPSLSSGLSGRPVIAYLDYVNTDGDASVAERSTVTVIAYNETTGLWERLNDGAYGTTDYYAAVTDGTVWEGYLIDQIEIVAGMGTEAYLAYRYVDPTLEPVYQPRVDYTHIHDVDLGGNDIPDVAEGAFGTSEIHAQWWNGSTWGPIGGGGNPIDLSGTWASLASMLPPNSGGWNSGYREVVSGGFYEYEGLNFDPSLLMMPNGDLWIAFSVGRTARHWDTSGEVSTWWLEYETTALLTEIAVYEFDRLDGTWVDRFGDGNWDELTPNGGKNSFAHADLAIGSDGLPMLVFEDQTWEIYRLQELTVPSGLPLLDPDSVHTSSDPNDRQLALSGPGDTNPSWGYEVPDAMDPAYDAESFVPTGNERPDTADVVNHPHAVIEGIIHDLNDATYGDDVDFFKITGLDPGRTYTLEITEHDFESASVPGEEGRPTLGFWVVDGSEPHGYRLSAIATYDEGDIQPLNVVADVNGELMISVSGYGDILFDGWLTGGTGIYEQHDTGTYTLEVTPSGDPASTDRVWVSETAWQQLESSSIRSLQFRIDPVTNGNYWQLTAVITPDEDGVAYVLPQVANAAGQQGVLTYTSLELDRTGFPTGLLTEWAWDFDARRWVRLNGYHEIDLSLRSYFEGDFGADGLADFLPTVNEYADLVTDYFDPRVLYGARQVDFEKAWWITKAGIGAPNDGLIPNVQDDYLTPIPGDRYSHDTFHGFRTDGHTADTSYIMVRRWNGYEWEQISSVDQYGTPLDSADDTGLNAWLGDPLGGGQDLGWAPGFISSVAFRGLGEGLQDMQPVVAWNYIEMNLIHVRGWAPDVGTSADLPRLEVVESSGTQNDDVLHFGQIQTVDVSTPVTSTEFRTITLQNTGGEVLTVNDIFFGGAAVLTVTDVNNNVLADASTPLTPFTIDPGGSKILRVYMKATEPGPVFGTLYIATNDPLQEYELESQSGLFYNWYTIDVEGIAYSGADLLITETVGIENDLAVTFGLVEQGRTSATQIVTIGNLGTEELNVSLSISGSSLANYGSFQVFNGSVWVSAMDLVIAPNDSVDVQLRFNGTAANEEGVIGYLVIEHDDWGSEEGLVLPDDRRPYLVQLVGNMPSLEEQTEVAVGTNPALGNELLAYNNVLNGLSIYDMTAEEIETLVTASSGRARTDGNLTVFSVSGQMYVYDHTTGTAVNLSTPLGMAGYNPSIDGSRIVFAAGGTGDGFNIFYADLNIVGGSVDTNDPVSDPVEIVDPSPSSPAEDNYADVSGDWIVWRRGSQEGEYTVWGYHLGDSEAMEISVGSVDGPRLPRVSGDYVTWVENNGGNQIMLCERNDKPVVLFYQQADVSDEVAFYGSLLAWSDNRNGNFDVYAYYLPEAAAGQGGVDIRGRQLQLTFSLADEVNPDVWGNGIAWRDDLTGMLYFSEVPYGVADIEVPQEGTPIAFGDVVVGVASVYEFTIQNVGTGPLTIDQLESDDVQAVLMPTVVLGGETLKIQQGSTLLVQLVLTATSAGPVSGTVTIHSDDANDPLITLNFTATAHVPEMVVTETSGTHDDNTLEMGNLLVGQSAMATFTVRNDATVAPLYVTEITSSDPSLTIELVSGSSQIDPGQEALYQVTWAPTAGGILNATLEIITNDLDESPYALTIIGSAQGVPNITVQESSGTFNDDKIEFGSVAQGSGLVSRTFTIINDGTEVLNVTGWTLTGDGADAFAVLSGAVALPSSFSLAANGGSRVVTVQFDTSVGGDFAATLTLFNNDPDAADAAYEVEFEGSVKSGQLVVTPVDLEFGQVESGETSASQEFWLVNNGESILTITSVTTTNAAFTVTAPTGYGGTFTLNPGQTTPAFTVTFNPTAAGDYTAAVRVVSNDPDTPILDRPILTGEGVDVADLTVLGVPQGGLQFGDVPVGDSADRTITLRNDGTADLHISRWTSNNTAYTLSPTNGADGFDDITLAPGGQMFVTVTFTPPATVSYPGVITIYSDDPNEGTYQIQVSGEGATGAAVGDFNGDGRLDVTDFELFQGVFGSVSGDGTYDPAYDLDGDFDVDYADLGIFLGYFDEEMNGSEAVLARSSQAPRVESRDPGVATPAPSASESDGSSDSPTEVTSGGETGDDQTVVMDNLAAAFDMGALPDPVGAQTGSTLQDEETEPAAMKADGQLEAEATAVVEAKASAGVSLSGLTATGQTTASLALPLQADASVELDVDQLGDVDPLVAPYARALLSSS